MPFQHAKNYNVHHQDFPIDALPLSTSKPALVGHQEYVAYHHQAVSQHVSPTGPGTTTLRGMHVG